MARPAKPFRPAIARRLAIRVVVLSSVLLSTMLPAASVAGADEYPSIGVDVESTDGKFPSRHYELSLDQIRQNQDVSEVMTVLKAGSAPQQLPIGGISFARIAQLGGLEVGQIDGMTVSGPGLNPVTLVPAEIVGFSDGNLGDSEPVMAVVDGTQAGSSLFAYFPWQPGRERQMLTSGQTKEALVVSIQVRGLVLKAGPVEASPTEPEEGQKVTFSLPTVELEGQPDPQVEYEWNFGDGGTSTEASPVHVFAERGAYTVTVRVRDPARDAYGTVPPALVRVSERGPGSPAPPPPPPSLCEGGGPPPCGKTPNAPPGAAGPAQGSPEGTTSGSPDRKQGASADSAAPHPKTAAHHPKSRAGHGQGGEEGSGAGTGSGAGGNDGEDGGFGGGSTGAEGAATGSGSGQAQGSAASEGTGHSGRRDPEPSDGAAHDPTPTVHHPAADPTELVGVLIDPSSGALRREAGSSGGGAHRSPSSLLGLSSGADSSDDTVTWVLVGLSLVASVALGTFSELWPWRRRPAGWPGRIRMSGEGS